MKDKKLKIVLDTDVVLHFMKGSRLSLLLDIFASECEYVMLSTTYDEIRNRDQKNQIDNHINLLKNLTKVKFNPTGEMRRVYAMLTSQFGKGESACMAYCQFEHHVIGSNNTRDIREYCNNHGIFLPDNWRLSVLRDKKREDDRIRCCPTDCRRKGTRQQRARL